MDKKEQYTINQFYKDLNNGVLFPVYLFYGQEDFITEQLTDSIVKITVEQGTEDFNYDIYYANEIEASKIINTAMAFPMMANKRTVVVKNVHLLNDKAFSILARYVKKPSETTCLILTSTTTSLSQKKWREIKSDIVFIETKQLYDNQIPQWIKKHVHEKGLTISDEALSLLHMNTGNSLRRLSSEIDKLVLILSDKKNITPRDVENVVGVSKEYTVFEFCDAVSEKRIEKSLKILNRLFQLGESPIGILVMLTRHFTIISKTKEYKFRKINSNEMCKLLKINPFFLNKYMNQANQYSRIQLAQIFKYLLSADQNLKTSYQPQKLVLENLLFQMFYLSSS